MQTNEQLATLAQRGEKDALAMLWKKTNALLYQKASVYFRSHTETCIRCGVELADLKQECYGAFLEAVKAYQPNQETKFLSYVNFPFQNAVNALLGLRTERGRNEPLNHAASLDKPLETDEGDGGTLHDILPDAASVCFLDALDRDAEAAFIRQVVAELPEPYRVVIQAYFFEGRTLGEIGEGLGMTAERVRQIKSRALQALRKHKQLRQLYNEHKQHNNWLQAARWEYSPEHFALIQRLQERELSYGYRQAALFAAREAWEKAQATFSW